MMFRTKKQPSGEVRSVRLAFAVLETLADSNEPLGVTEIAKALGITKTRGYRHLRTLLNSGYVTQDPETEKYQAGIKLFLLGQNIAGQHDFLTAVRRVMRPLRDALGHTVTVSEVDNGEIVVLDMVRGSSAFEIGTKPGSRLPLDRSAQGKVALAFGDPSLLRRPRSRPAKGEGEIRLVRKRRWAVAPEEILRGVNALAAPVLFGDGSLAGTIALVDSVEILPPKPTRKQLSALQYAAEGASRELGYEP